MQKMEVSNFRIFFLKNSGILGQGKTEIPEIRKSEFPELQPLDANTVMDEKKGFSLTLPSAPRQHTSTMDWQLPEVHLYLTPQQSQPVPPPRPVMSVSDILYIWSNHSPDNKTWISGSNHLSYMSALKT